MNAVFHRDTVPVARSPEDHNRLALASLMAGAVERFRTAAEMGDEIALIAALTDLDALKNRARTEKAVGLLYRCDVCAQDFPAERITVGSVNLCVGCAS